MTGAQGDPGLQPERTRLSWSRTSLAFAANGALLLKTGLEGGRWVGALPGLVVLAFAAAVHLLGAGRGSGVGTGRPRAGHHARVAAVAVLAVLTGLDAALAVGLGLPGRE